MTIRGQMLVSRTDDDSLPPCVWIQERHRVYVQNVPVCTGTTRTCFNTRARGAGIHRDVECTHGDVFEPTHGFFSTFFQRAAAHKHTPNTQRPPNNTTTTTTHTTQHNTQHNTQHHTETERKRERQRETRQDKRRRYKTRRQDKMKERRDKKTREDRKKRRERRQEERMSKTREETG